MVEFWDWNVESVGEAWESYGGLIKGKDVSMSMKGSLTKENGIEGSYEELDILRKGNSFS